MPQIYDTGPTALLPLRMKAKNPTVSAGFEPANLDTKGQHATPRPPKPLCMDMSVQIPDQYQYQYQYQSWRGDGRDSLQDISRISSKCQR